MKEAITLETKYELFLFIVPGLFSLCSTKFVIKYNELRYINIANYGYNEDFSGVPRNSL